MYDQPNLELGREIDFADPIGNLFNLFFIDITVSKRTQLATFQVASNVDGMTVKDVQCEFDLEAAVASGYRLVDIGPLSATHKRDPADVKTWVEIFSPDKDCTVQDLKIFGVSYRLGPGQAFEGFKMPNKLVRLRRQRINPSYPNTTPSSPW